LAMIQSVAKVKKSQATFTDSVPQYDSKVLKITFNDNAESNSFQNITQ